MKQLRNRIDDYKNGSYILIAASVLLYLGIVLTGHGKSEFQLMAIFTAILLFIQTAFRFALGSILCTQKLIKKNEEIL